MKIYVVIHSYDNGESYEDYREYEDYSMFSSEAKAYAYYCEMILSDYEGQYSIKEWELDTQERTLIEKSPWVKCSSMYEDDYAYLEDYEPEDSSEDSYPNPMEDYKDYWSWDDDIPLYDSTTSEEEVKSLYEYFTSPGTNYKEYQECEEELKERRDPFHIEKLKSLLMDW